MLEHINFAKEMNVKYPLKVENGDIVRLSPGSPEVYDKAPYGKVFLDGHIPVEEDSQFIKERKNLSSNGFLSVTIIITSKGKIYNNVFINFLGLPIYEVEQFKNELQELIESTTRTFSLNNKKQEENYKEAIKIICRKFSKEKTGKKPITNISLVRI